MHTPPLALPASGGVSAPAGEWKAVPLLALGFGMVGLDRFIINPLFPVMARDLGLSYQQLGLISGVLALTWGIAAIFCGGLADRFGPKKVLVPAMVAFSLLVAFTGLATGIGSLLVIRAVMGVAEGAFMPAGIVATTEASAPQRVGLNTGIVMASVGLFGMGLAPVLATRLLHVVPSWHWVFGLVALPGLLLAISLQKVLRGRSMVLVTRNMPAAPQPGLRAVLAHRNVVVAALCAACWLSAMISMQAFLPSYLVDHLKLGMDAMGLMLAGTGLGSMVGMIGLASLSDRFGRKPVMLGAAAVELVVLGLLMRTGADPAMLSSLLFLQALCNTGLIVITVGPVATQSVPRALAATSSGLVMGVGEVVGGALAPALIGTLATAHGITLLLPAAASVLALGLLVTLFALREPQPVATVVTPTPATRSAGA